MKGLLTIALAGLCLVMFLPERTNAQETCSGAGCQAGLYRIVPQLQFQPGQWQPRVRATNAPLAQVMPWNWNARVVRYKQDWIFQPSGPWQAPGGSARMNPGPMKETSPVPIPQQSTRVIYRLVN